MSQEDTLSQHFAGASFPPLSETRRSVINGPVALLLECLNSGEGKSCLNFVLDKMDKPLCDR